MAAELTKPFSRLFASGDEARWAFDLLNETLNRLGIKSLDDERFALTLVHDGRVLRLNFGNWAVLQFYGPGYSQYRVGMALIDEQANLKGEFNRWEPFKQSEPSISGYDMPLDVVKPLQGSLRRAYENTCANIAARFQHWSACNYRRYNQPEIAEAVFDSEKRARLFERGLGVSSPPEPDSKLPGEEPELNPKYSLAQCAAKLNFEQETLASWVYAIERKKQAIIYGPPGTGKTYAAEHLAQHLIGGGDGFCELVQFHPAYAYEDFVQGIRPAAREGGGLDYPLRPGRFLDFCHRAAQRKDACVLIIDEINRANLARVFGELMYLLEYRQRSIPLAGGGSFAIPTNVRIIGTMNTADRSIALVDHALRRRFAFLALYPDYEVLRRYHQNTGLNVEPLITVLQQLNQRIGDHHYQVGITFFLHSNLGEQIRDIWRMEIEPYLEEYFFDQSSEVDTFRWEKVKDKLR